MGDLHTHLRGAAAHLPMPHHPSSEDSSSLTHTVEERQRQRPFQDGPQSIPWETILPSEFSALQPDGREMRHLTLLRVLRTEEDGASNVVARHEVSSRPLEANLSLFQED